MCQEQCGFVCVYVWGAMDDFYLSAVPTLEQLQILSNTLIAVLC